MKYVLKETLNTSIGPLTLMRTWPCLTTPLMSWQTLQEISSLMYKQAERLETDAKMITKVVFM